MKRLRFFILNAILVSVMPTMAQQRHVVGVVTDSQTHAPIEGAAVKVLDTQLGTSTDAEGRFVLPNVPNGATLEISSVGFIPKQVSVPPAGELAISLEAAVDQLEEVVVVGYGTQKRATVTGAVSSIQGDDIAQIPAPNVSHSIAGRLPGVSMRPNGGQPGSDDPDIHIRGIVTTGANQPLIVVDGVRRDNIRQIDPAAIESVTILKDAAAVAPFGIGGANGVIMITTKKGRTGKPTIHLGTSYGFQNPTYLPDMLDARDYMALQNEAYYSQTPNGTSPPFDPDFVNNYHALHQENPWQYPNSNFLELFNKNTPVQSHNLDLSGGTEHVTYRAGLGYFDQQGLFDKVSYRRYNYNVNLESNVTPTTKVGLGIHGSVERTNDLDADAQTSGQLFRSFYKYLPTQSLTYPGTDYWGESSANTPVGVLRSDGYDRRDLNTLLGSFFVEQQIVDGLSVKGVFSYDPSQTNVKSFHVPFKYHVINLNTSPYTYTEAVSLQEGTGRPYTWLGLENRRRTNYTYQGFINYDRAFGDHQLTGLLVAEARNYTENWFTARRNNFSLQIDELGLGSSNRMDFENDGLSATGSEIGYVYRVGYSYKQRYIVEAAGRYDGHYYFAPGRRWGYFPSFSGAWRISEEQFFEPLKGWLSEFKLRGSWGKAGMLAGEAFQYLTGYSLRGNAYAFGSGSLVQGSSAIREANPNITWEVSTKSNIGFDALLWNGTVNVEFDYFTEQRTGMLLAPQVTLPVEYGLSLSEENKGEMANRGFEINAGIRRQPSASFGWSLSGNASFARNRMIEVFQTDAERDNPNRTRVGRPFGTPYGYKSLGLFSTQDDINGDGIIDEADGYNVRQFGVLRPGDIRYADLSGPDGVPDGVIDNHDLTVIGYPVYPQWTFGLMPSANWKGVDLSLFFQGSANSSVNLRQFMTVPFENNGSNTGYEYFNNRWTPDNQAAKYPRATPSPQSNNVQDSDFWLVNSSYLRLKTLTLGYTLPDRARQWLGGGGLRVYLVSNNLLTFSKIKHIDPELGYDDRETAYPVIKSTTFGLELTF
ncbi:TonB-dependent receptor [Parapedobacter sp. ISTM3]|uniref:SusC/RagA family TonB-linked outer membrane protein n=1 Tax=Parapedobacter sp. ISTM3 TaxID=2800130 RepID=UPI00190786C3|nr:TonB-dependent receptor [Parapedobacter sp. ISTM3]MBK1439601.1 TonB-dependent receptor [Parapedobacter sp. ISTM3]